MSYPHFDLTKTKRAEAIKLGAVKLTLREMVKKRAYLACKRTIEELTEKHKLATHPMEKLALALKMAAEAARLRNIAATQTEK